jgi:anti-sigma B factor antagonist
MEIIKNLDGNALTISLVGELNTVSAPDLEKVIKDELVNVKSLVLDLAKLDYLSSAGLRVVLMAQKMMGKKGGMVVKHVNSEIMDIFDMTGFSAILTIEN